MNSPNAQWIMDQIEFNYKGRWIVQREILIKDRMAMFEKTVSNSATERVWKRHAEEKIGVCERELENRDKEYQRLQEKMKQQKPMSGPLQQKYFETREQNEFWFLTDFLRDECAARGGCCSQGCGCCERPRSAETSRDFRHGHCTADCVCCHNRRGFVLNYKERERFEAFPIFSLKRNLAYMGEYVYGAAFAEPLPF